VWNSWDNSREYERLGLDDAFYQILGLSVPLIRMPVAPGRNIAILVEVAARNQLLRSRGQHAAKVLADKLEQQLRAALSAADGIADEVDDEESGA
jgi:HPr kinase/phosphorylase